MQFHQHEFDSVEGYLHHRAPYLMVDRIIEVASLEIRTEKKITGDEFFLAGHFPGAPVFPGAMMQELTTQSAGILIASKFNPMKEFNTDDPHFNEYALGVLVKVTQSRFKGFARPGDTLCVHVVLDERVSNVFDFSANIRVGDATIMRNRFRLMNIESKTLVG